MTDQDYLKTMQQSLGATAKSGIQTTEWKGLVWLAGIVPILTMILISTGMSNDQATNMAMAVINGINAIVSFSVYVYSRVKQKNNQSEMLTKLLVEHINASRGSNG